MFSRREVLICAPIPPWHRIAYRDFGHECAVAYPIGLHLVVKLYRRVWEWSYRYKPSRLERMLQEAERRGRESERQRHEEELGRFVEELREARTAANGDQTWSAFYKGLARAQRGERRQ